MMVDVISMPSQVDNEVNRGLGVIPFPVGFSSYELVVPFPKEESRLLAVVKPFQPMVICFRANTFNIGSVPGLRSVLYCMGYLICAMLLGLAGWRVGGRSGIGAHFPLPVVGL